MPFAVQNPLSSIAADVASTNRLINAQDSPVPLVGHSYGDPVITEAGNNRKSEKQTWLACPFYPMQIDMPDI
jgi:hypothetical protein